MFASGAGRPATRGVGNPVIELEYGITVYPARDGRDRWRAVWYEDGTRRQCEAVSQERLAARLETVTERLAADAPNMERTGADLIAHYLDADRLPADRRWSRKHAHTQRRLCERFAAPVIGGVACQDIKTWHMQQCGCRLFIRAGQAACRYSWRVPPSRSGLRTSKRAVRSGSVIGSERRAQRCGGTERPVGQCSL